MPMITYHAEATTLPDLRDEIVADLRKLAAEQTEQANAAKQNKVATAFRNRAAALEERADFWAAVKIGAA